MGKLKQRIMFLPILFGCLYLCSCSQSSNKLIEIGFDVTGGNGGVRPFESGFETKIRVDAKKEPEKQLEIFYGNTYSDCWSQFSFSDEQAITFTLKRLIVTKEKSEIVSEDEILCFERPISYFFSEEFHSKTNFVIDTVSYDQLLKHTSQGYLSYSFTLEPNDGEPLTAIYVGERRTNFGEYVNRIKCYDARSIGFVLDNGSISFVAPPRRGNDNV